MVSLGAAQRARRDCGLCLGAIRIMFRSRASILSRKSPRNRAFTRSWTRDVCLFVGEAWNLKARLLELMNIIKEVGRIPR